MFQIPLPVMLQHSRFHHCSPSKCLFIYFHLSAIFNIGHDNSFCLLKLLCDIFFFPEVFLLGARRNLHHIIMRLLVLLTSPEAKNTARSARQVPMTISSRNTISGCCWLIL